MKPITAIEAALKALRTRAEEILLCQDLSAEDKKELTEIAKKMLELNSERINIMKAKIKELETMILKLQK